MRTPELTRIAEALVEREWLDMRVLELGMVGRVVPMNITVWPDRDDVLFRQEFVVKGERAEKELVIDAEDIMWLKASVLTLEDVIPPIMPDPPPDLKPDNERLALAIQDAVVAHKRITVDQLLKDTKQPGTSARKLCIRLMWELTTIAQSDIPQHFGYQSGGMSTQSLDWTEEDERATDDVREIHRLLERQYGHQLPPADRPCGRHRQRLIRSG